MEDINITIPASQIEDAVANSLGTSFKDDLVSAVQDDMNNNLEQYICEDTILEMVREDMKNHIYYYVDEDDMHDLIDADNIADKVMDKIDVEDIMSDYDISGQLTDLARSYDPVGHCSLGEAVTNVMKEGFIYLLRNDEDVAAMIKGFMTLNSAVALNESPKVEDGVIKFTSHELQKLISDVRHNYELPAHVRFFISQ